MPIRIASLTQRISQNGQALHRAATSRVEAMGEESEPSAAEKALMEERESLKREREKRQAKASEPKPTAAERLVRTHHPQAKEKPKATAESKDTKTAKAGKPHRTRAEKAAAKAAALDAARRSPKKPAKG
jgi:hypothetical protein